MLKQIVALLDGRIIVAAEALVAYPIERAEYPAGTPEYFFRPRFYPDVMLTALDASGQFDTSIGKSGQIYMGAGEQISRTLFPGSFEEPVSPNEPYLGDTYNVVFNFLGQFAGLNVVNDNVVVVQTLSHVLHERTKLGNVIDESKREYISAIRVNMNGTRDNTFGVGGLAYDDPFVASSESTLFQSIYPFANQEQQVSHVNSNGSVTVAFNASPGINQPTELHLKRFTSNGQPDVGFGQNGTLRPMIASGTSDGIARTNGTAVEFLQDDSLVIETGQTGGSGLIHLNADGKPMLEFGHDGAAVVPGYKNLC